jgi:hypothetical protein
MLILCINSPGLSIFLRSKLVVILFELEREKDYNLEKKIGGDYEKKN